MRKSEMKVSIKRTNDWDLFLKRLFAIFDRKKKIWPQARPFFDILVFKTFLKNYPAKLEIEV